MDDPDWLVVYIALIILQSINVLLHCSGFYLLRCLYANDRGDLQLLLIMNLSASEILLNVTYVLIFSCNISILQDTHSTAKEVLFLFILLCYVMLPEMSRKWYKTAHKCFLTSNE